MCHDFYLKPRDANTFCAEAIERMNEWFESYPIYRRSDGAIVLCHDTNFRDGIIQSGRRDTPTSSTEVIVIAPEGVTLGLAGLENLCEIVFKFVEFVQAQWPCEILTEDLFPITIDALRLYPAIIDGRMPPE